MTRDEIRTADKATLKAWLKCKSAQGAANRHGLLLVTYWRAPSWDHNLECACGGDYVSTAVIGSVCGWARDKDRATSRLRAVADALLIMEVPK